MESGNPKVKSNKLIIGIVLFCIAVTFISAVVVFLINFGVFDKEPVVEIQADNTYSETLRVATDWDYKPFSYIENDEYKGLDVEMVAEVANRMGMNLELTLMDWNDAQAGLYDGTYDIILNMESNAVLKDDKIIGTIPTDEKQYVVYGKNRIEYVGELYGMRVAAYNKFDELGMDVITGFSYQEMFEKLLSDELDYVICPIQIGDSFIEKLNAENQIVSSYQVSYMYGCMALRSEDIELCAKLNRVIKDMQTEGVIDKLDQKWVTSRYGTVTVRQVIEHNPVIVVLLIMLLQMIIVGIVVIAFTTSNAKKQQAYAEELQNNLDIIHKQNEELKIANEKAQAASVAKSNFLFNMSHDIRTPMNAIIGFTNLAVKHIGDDEKIRDYLSKISDSSKLLLGLINDILEMARIENGKAQLDPAPENIVEIMEQTESVVTGQAKEKNQELIFEINVSHKFVICDRLKLNQILMNLISNAVKYTNENGHILVSLKETGSTDKNKAGYIIRVKDDGIGMSEEFQQKIFESFEREKSSTVTKITGTGLGMSITKSLVDLMGGEITLKSGLGKGSEFTVKFEFEITGEPIKPAEEAADAETELSGDVSYRILVVDDNEINRIIAVEVLSDLGYETDEAGDGQEAIDKIKNAKAGDYDLILMDVQMPVIDGYEATKAIRKLDSPLSSVPILALTANAFDDDRKNAEEAGMNGHVAKPIDVEVLEKTMRNLLKN